jgi:hypothetical protein
MPIPRKDSVKENGTIKLLTQDKEGDCRFDSQFVATATVIAKFGVAVIATAHTMLLNEVRQKGGLDYLQVFEIDGERLWFIDDVSHVTCLLPDDY